MGYLTLLKRKELQKESHRKAALREAEKLSALLRQKFNYEALYLIGSVVKKGGFGYHSDIDLVVKGLKKEFFFKVLAFLLKKSAFNIDLKPWEELSMDSKTKVEREGRVLY